MITRTRTTTQLVLDAACGVLAIATAGVALWGPLMSSVIPVTTVISVGCTGVMVAGLVVHRVSMSNPHTWTVACVISGVCADVVLWSSGQERSGEHPVAMLFYIVAYLCGLTLVISHARTWTRWHHRVLAIDSAMFSVAFASLLIAVTSVHFTVDRSQWGTQQVFAVLFPVLDIALIVMISRIWFSPGGNVPALRWVLAGVMALVFGDIWNLRIAWTASAYLRDFNHLWLVGFVALTVALTRPSVRRTPGEEPRDDPTLFGVMQCLGLVMALSAPASLLLIWNVINSNHLPWNVVAGSYWVIAPLVGSRVWILASALRTQYARAENMARSDPLTGAANRRRWDHAFTDMIELSERQEQAFHVAIIDLDHFKLFNDQFGHQAGDRLLIEAVAAWEAYLKSDDLLARYGGEEFTVMLTTDSRRAAVSTVRRMCQAVPHGATASAGITRWRSGMSADEVIHEADSALYAAKRAGRNRVTVHPETKNPMIVDVAGSSDGMTTDLRSSGLLTQEPKKRT